MRWLRPSLAAGLLWALVALPAPPAHGQTRPANPAATPAARPTARGTATKPVPARAARPRPAKPTPTPRVAPQSPRAEARPTATPPTQKKDDDDTSDEALLRDLEKDVDEAPKKRQASRASGAGGRIQRFIQSLNPDLSAIGCLAGAYFYDHPLKGKGNVVPQGGHDAGKTGFHLQEIELALQAAVDPYFRMDAFLSISLHGLHVEEAYFTTLGLPGGLQARLGHFFHRFGRFNTQHLHSWAFADSMIPVTRLLGAEGLGSLAGEVSWLMPLPWYVMLSAAITGPSLAHSFVGEGDRKAGYHIRHPGHLLYVFHLGQFFEASASWGVSVGVSYAIGPNNSGGHDLNMTHLFGADLFVKYRNLRRPYSDIHFTVEGYGRLAQVPDDQLLDWGLYAQASFRLAKRWWLALRYDMVEIGDSAKLQAFGFAEASSNPEHPNPLDDQLRGAVALTYRPTHFSQFRIQYNHTWTRRMDDEGRPDDFQLGHAVILQFQGNIGAHGAHPY